MRSLTTALTLCLVVAACTVTRGSGDVETLRREVSGFDRVELDGSGTAIVQPGQSFSLELEADDNVVDLLTYEVDGDTLRLGIEPGTTVVFASEIIFRVGLPDLAGVAVEGSGRLDVVDADGADLEVRLDGSGEIVATGRLDYLDLTVAGSGEFDGERIDVRSARVSIEGSGRALVAVSDRLDAIIDGSGEIIHVGQPDELNVDVDGSGEVRRE